MSQKCGHAREWGRPPCIRDVMPGFDVCSLHTGLPRPQHRRWLVAQTCWTCGHLCEARKFTRTAGMCTSCRSRQVGDLLERNARYRERSHAAHLQAQMTKNHESWRGARHRREPWTAPDLEVAIREDGMSIEDKAALLGRSIAGVEVVRRKVRAGNSRLLMLLGASR